MKNPITIIEQSWSKIGMGMKVVFMIIMSFIIYMISVYIIMLLQNKSGIDWWWNPPLTNNNAKTKFNGSAYSHLFNINSVYAWQTSSILFSIVNLWTPPSANIQSDKYQFLYNNILKNRMFIGSDGKQIGVVTPKSLCITVLVYPGDGDDTFDQWWNGGNQKRRGKPVDMLKQSTWNATTTSKCLTEAGTSVDGKQVYGDCTSYERESGDGDTIGFYPKADDSSGWKGMILDWLNINELGKQTVFRDGNNKPLPNAKWVMVESTMVDSHISVPFFYVPNTAGYSQGEGNALDNWYSRGDNIFGRMGIGPWSPIISFGTNNTFIYSGVKVNAGAFQDLLGGGTAVGGGWLGMIRGAGSESSSDDLYDAIKAQIPTKFAPPPAPCKSANVGAGVAAGLSSGTGLALMAPLMGFPMGIFAVVAGLIVGGISGVKAGSGNCPALPSK